MQLPPAADEHVRMPWRHQRDRGFDDRLQGLSKEHDDDDSRNDNRRRHAGDHGGMLHAQRSGRQRKSDREDEDDRQHVQDALDARRGGDFDQGQMALPREDSDARGFTETERHDVVDEKADAVRPERVRHPYSLPQEQPPDFAADEIERRRQQRRHKQPPEIGKTEARQHIGECDAAECDPQEERAQRKAEHDREPLHQGTPARDAASPGSQPNDVITTSVVRRTRGIQPNSRTSHAGP